LTFEHEKLDYCLSLFVHRKASSLHGELGFQLGSSLPDSF